MYKVKWPNGQLSAGLWLNKESAAQAAKEAIKQGWAFFVLYEIVEVDGYGYILPKPILEEEKVIVLIP